MHGSTLITNKIVTLITFNEKDTAKPTKNCSELQLRSGIHYIHRKILPAKVFLSKSATNVVTVFIIAIKNILSSAPYFVKYFFRYFPVYEPKVLATSSGVPDATNCPPFSPPSGPISII